MDLTLVFALAAAVLSGMCLVKLNRLEQIVGRRKGGKGPVRMPGRGKLVPFQRRPEKPKTPD